MLKELYTAALGMQPQQTRLELIANNMANANTPGFKRASLFERNLIDARENLLNTPGDVESEDAPIGSYIDFSKGDFEKTDNDLDIAISNPEGFFVLEDEYGERTFSRSGHFTLSDEGTIITTDGKMLMGENGPLNIQLQTLYDPFNADNAKTVNVKITENGEVYANDLDVGALDIVKISNPESLTNISNANFVPTEDTYIEYLPQEEVQVKQGWLEGSNVDIISEMVSMIELQRTFELGSKVIRTNDSTIDDSLKLGRYY